MSGPQYHGWTHRPNYLGGSDPITPHGHFAIKVFADRNALDGELPDEAIVVSTGDGKFVFQIPADLDGTSLVHASAFVSLAGDVTVQIANDTQSFDYLSTPITTDGGNSSYLASTQPVIDDPHPVADMGDLIRIDVDAADGTAEGLGVNLSWAII